MIGYENCSKYIMNEKIVKSKIIEWLIKTKKHEVVVTEVAVGNVCKKGESARSDIFAVNGDISIYEVKTDRDTLTRLDNQINFYTLYADKVSVVVADKFIEKVTELPQNIGIYRYDKKGIYEIRPPIKNNIQFDKYLEYWWVKELKEIFRGFHKWYELYDETAKEKLLNTLTKEQIINLTLYRLKERYKEESEALKESVFSGTKFEKRKFQSKLNITPLKDIPMKELLGMA